jgi:hypothetical protein
MPPDLEDKLPDGRDADRRGPVDPGRSGPRTDARPGSPSGLRRPRAGSHARERRGGPGGAVPAHRNAGACSWPAVRPRIARRSRWVIRTVRETRALPPLCALIAANGLAVQGTPEWSFCVPEADTHRGNAAWSSRPRVLAASPPAQTRFAALGRAVVCQRRVGRGRLKAQYDPENLFRRNYSVSGPRDRPLSCADPVRDSHVVVSLVHRLAVLLPWGGRKVEHDLLHASGEGER